MHLLSPSIRRPAIEANHFEINLNIIQSLQSHVQFGGFPTEDPIAHILNFLEVCDTFKQNGVSEDAVKLWLFPLSLRDRAKWWLNSLPAGSITTWEDLANKFLAKYVPLGKTVKLQNDIMSFCQYDYENLYEAWERFNDLFQRCPHHGFPKWLQSERHMSRSAIEINKVEVINALSTQIATLAKKVHSLRVQTSVDAISSFISCELCKGKHLYDQCPENSKFEYYTSNSSWFNALSSSQESKAPPPLVESKPSMVEMPLTYKAKTYPIIHYQNTRSQVVSLRNLETRLENLAKTLNNQPHGALSGNTELNPRSDSKEHCKAITLTSEKEMEGNLGAEEVDKEPFEEATITEECFKVCLVNDVVNDLDNDDELKYHPIDPSKSSSSFNAKWDTDEIVMKSPSLVQCYNFMVDKLLHLLFENS
ncbi:uncharacterized protein G2W53_021835 [Senna tora]|uniref:Retrotransposon gag domain-containing protein n=1 Tax=Senna tora TaxID=362788 RepID=A0A834TMM4_9FABA|nr:uncharacterized protein G2W53_021835 [Senna tora]